MPTKIVIFVENKCISHVDSDYHSDCSADRHNELHSGKEVAEVEETDSVVQELAA